MDVGYACDKGDHKSTRDYLHRWKPCHLVVTKVEWYLALALSLSIAHSYDITIDGAAPLTT